MQSLGRSIADSIAVWAAHPNSSNSDATAANATASDSNTDSAAAVLRDWHQWVDWSAALEIRATGQKVLPLGLNEDGTLRVKDQLTGAEQTLAAEYLY